MIRCPADVYMHCVLLTQSIQSPGFPSSSFHSEPWFYSSSNRSSLPYRTWENKRKRWKCSKWADNRSYHCNMDRASTWTCRSSSERTSGSAPYRLHLKSEGKKKQSFISLKTTWVFLEHIWSFVWFQHFPFAAALKTLCGLLREKIKLRSFPGQSSPRRESNTRSVTSTLITAALQPDIHSACVTSSEACTANWVLSISQAAKHTQALSVL